MPELSSWNTRWSSLPAEPIGGLIIQGDVLEVDPLPCRLLDEPGSV